MSGKNVIRLDPKRRGRSLFLEDGIIAMLIFLVFDSMMFAGMAAIFVLTRVAAGAPWPPPGQPWFPPAETAINSAVLLGSGALVFLAARAWEKRDENRVGLLLFTAIVLGTFFIFFQGVIWVKLIGEGLNLISSQHGRFFCLIVGMHSANALGALIFLGIAWLRLRSLSDDGEPRGTLSSSTFSAARILWYFVVGTWPVLYLLLYL